MFGFRKPQRNKTVAVFDFPSSSVGGIMVRSGVETGGPEVMASARRASNFLFDVDLDASIRCAMESFKQVLDKLRNDYKEKPDSVLCVFSSPWFLSQTKIININKSKSFELKEDLLEKVVSDEKESLKNEIFSLSPNGKKKGASSEPLDHDIIKVELNGYSPDLPMGKVARNARIYIYISAGVKELIGKIKKELANKFGPVPVRFKTFPIVAFRSLNSIINHEEGFLIVDVSGEVTDVILIRGNNLEGVVSFPAGVNSLYRKIASDSNTFLKEAESILMTHFRGHGDAALYDKVERSIKDKGKEWGGFFEKALESLFENHPLPQNVFFMGDSVAEKYFIRFAESADFSKYAILGKPFSVKAINSGWLRHYFNAGAGAKKERAENIDADAKLTIESLFAINY